MIPIKFRAWHVKKCWDTDKEVCRMVYFGEMGYCNEYNLLSFELHAESRDKEGGTYCNLSADIDEFKNVMQFTGLLDKNGKEIYEGDILSDKRSVAWGDGAWYSVRKNLEYGYHLASAIAKEIEVIGNIHENRELLA